MLARPRPTYYNPPLRTASLEMVIIVPTPKLGLSLLTCLGKELKGLRLAPLRLHPQRCPLICS